MMQKLSIKCGILQTVIHRRSEPIGPPSTGRPILNNDLPDNTGDNKLTKEMVPGYTGSLKKFSY